MTEQEFVVALILSISGAKSVHIQLGRQFQGSVTIKASSPKPSDDFFILVVDCAGDEQVKTQIRDQYASLVAAGYSGILGLRDVFPFTHEHIRRLDQSLSLGIPTSPVIPEIYLAAMEIEAWFLADLTHLKRVSPHLTLPLIQAAGFNIAVEHPESWSQPAKALDSIYQLAGARYVDKHGKKSRRRVLRTIRALDIHNLCTSLRLRVNRMSRFISAVEQALL